MFSYDYPEDLVAERPAAPPESARLLVIANDGDLQDSTFGKAPSIFNDNDLLVLNDTKVVGARLLGTIGSKPSEILLVRDYADGSYLVMGKLPKNQDNCSLQGVNLQNEPFELRFSIISRHGHGLFEVKFSDSASVVNGQAIMPIPPYIRGGRSDTLDVEAYNTCFASQGRSIAAPTASLHFSPILLEQIAEVAKVRYVSLHLGMLSFLTLERVRDMPKIFLEEECVVPRDVWSTIQETKESGGRVIAVGTTVVRALESKAAGYFEERGMTDLLISEESELKIVDAMFTNFHQPNSSHLNLVAAFCGQEKLRKIYDHAVSRRYRLFSYGDGMFVPNLANQV